ncbi:MAG: CBS domain-containing protein [Chloroflexi bacterium]|nr:CBS domain-containing protein [Chloroflexota bacterium]
MLVRELMTIYPVYIFENSDVRHAAEVISLAEISEIMVVDSNHNLIGVVAEGDLLRRIMPDVEEIIAAGGTLSHAFTLFVEKGAQLAADPISHLVIRDPISVKPTDEVAQVATIMLQKQIRRLPVVDNKRLVGSISRSDICRAVIFNTNRGGEVAEKNSISSGI